MPVEIEEFVYQDFDNQENEKIGQKNTTKQDNNTSEIGLQHNNAKQKQQTSNQVIFNKEEIKNQLETIIETTKQEALKEAQLIKEQAKKEGFELGYKEGYEKGLKDSKGIFDKTIEEYTSKMQQAISKLIQTAHEISRKYEELENAATDMILDIAKKVIVKELKEDRNVINNMVKEALGLTDSKRIKVKLNPDDAKGVNLDNLDSTKEIELIKDKNLSKGSLVIEEENGNIIDASIDTKLNQIKDSLVNE